MVDAMISCARMRDLAPLGRFRPLVGPPGGPTGAVRCATPRLADAASIGLAPSPRPRAASPRPEEDDLVASTI